MEGKYLPLVIKQTQLNISRYVPQLSKAHICRCACIRLVDDTASQSLSFLQA
jgi:hypothetical protein